jgi:hypothetical protein
LALHLVKHLQQAWLLVDSYSNQYADCNTLQYTMPFAGSNVYVDTYGDSLL